MSVFLAADNSVAFEITDYFGRLSNFSGIVFWVVYLGMAIATGALGAVVLMKVLGLGTWLGVLGTATVWLGLNWVPVDAAVDHGGRGSWLMVVMMFFFLPSLIVAMVAYAMTALTLRDREAQS